VRLIRKKIRYLVGYNEALWFYIWHSEQWKFALSDLTKVQGKSLMETEDTLEICYNSRPYFFQLNTKSTGIIVDMISLKYCLSWIIKFKKINHTTT
jgi:hypothetical protein